MNEYTNLIPLKVWIQETAEKLGISDRAVEMRLHRKKLRYPHVVRVNKRVVFVKQKP